MKQVFLNLVLATTIASCSVFGSLTSNTSIKANESFVLAENLIAKMPPSELLATEMK